MVKLLDKIRDKGIVLPLVLYSISTLIFIFIVFNNTADSPSLNNGEKPLGVNLPDRCEFYGQIASRSVKDNVKSSGGTLYSYRVVSTSTALRYFRIHDLATVPTTGATVEYAMPLDTTTASASPKVIEEKFAVPMKFDNGIAWSLSTAFGTWGSVSTDLRNSYIVSLCYQ